MANVYSQVGYGLSQPLPTLAMVPIVSPKTPNQGVGRAPTVNDKYPIGTIWVWTTQQQSYLLVQIANNQAVWVSIGGGVLMPNAINLPNTNATATVGYIAFNSIPYLTNTGTRDIFLGALAGNPGNGVTGQDNVAMGHQALGNLLAGNGNVAVGSFALTSLINAVNNTSIGFNSGATLNTGTANVFIGRSAGTGISSGSQNVIIGDSTGDTLLTGSNNTIIGQVSGANYVGAESSNILIENSGIAAENNTIHIGTQGAGAGSQNRCFIAGIRGTTTGVADAIAVLIDSTGQLGTVSSSARYKSNIEDMADSSSGIMSLRPVTFTYKSDASNTLQYGLIAEEVETVMPRLVVRDAEGKPETIKYQDLPALLLNEVQKLRKELNALKGSQ